MAGLLVCLMLAAVTSAVHAADAGGRSATRTLAESATDTATLVWHGTQDLALYALSLIGVDYKYGGATPENGLDCSGLVHYVFAQVTGVTLPRTAKELARLGDKVAVSDLKPGDLVFFNTRRFAFSHVGIYLGENRFIHAPHSGREVEIVTFSGSYWQKRFNGARRLIGVVPDLIPTAMAQPPAAATPTEAASPVVAEPLAGEELR